MNSKKIISFISAFIIAIGGVSFSAMNNKNIVSTNAIFDFAPENSYMMTDSSMKIGYLRYGKLCVNGNDNVKYIIILECSAGAVDLEIPSEIEGYPVKEIYEADFKSSFNNCADLKNLIIPDTITSIGSRAFYNCIALENIKLSENLSSISNGLFTNCSSLKTLDIPSSVSSIGENAFINSGLENITIPANVKSIGKKAFSDCKSLEKIVIKRPDCKIADGAITQGKIYGYENSTAQTYAEKNGLEFEMLNDGEFEISPEKLVLRRIDKDSDGTYDYIKIFGYIGNDTDLKIPAEYNGLPVKSIGKGAFYYARLKSVYIPDSVEEIEDYAFHLCEASVINIPENIKSIGEGIFYAMTNLESIVIPDGIEYIGDKMFGACEKLKSVSMPDSIKKICASAFIMTGNLEEIKLSENLEIIDNYAFHSSGVKNINIPAKVSKIGDIAFDRAENITVDENNPYFIAVDGVLFTKDMKHLVQYPNRDKRTEYTVPDGVVEIDDRAFVTNTVLESVTMPESLKVIGWSNFERYTGLKEINLNEGLEIIRAEAFGGCTAVKSINIPYSVRLIEKMFFDICSSVTICGYENSYAQDYTVQREFISLGEYEGYSSGDISGDKYIDASDASLLLQEYTANSTGDESVLDREQLKYADLNDDGLIDATDASIVLAYYSYVSTGGTEKYIKNWYESENIQ